MKRKKRSGMKRLTSLTLAITVLWVVFVTAGSNTLGAALDALNEQGQAGVALLRTQLLLPKEEDPLNAAVSLVISQSPLLLSCRSAILSLRQQEESGETTMLPENRQPILEEPVIPEDPHSSFADNGVAARTLIPTTTEGYLLKDLAYISNSSRHALSEEDLTGDFAAALSDGAPQILIVHTHGSEAYTMPPGEEYVPSSESRTTDTNYNVVRIGDEIASVLAEYGISTIHDRSLHDYPNYSGAYDRSLGSIERYLADYPSITFVLDIHRDAIYDGEGTPYKVISSTAEGVSAQLSLVIGTNGSGLPHDTWQENLKLAAAVQNTILSQHPTLMRPIVVRNSRYNQHCTTGSLLVEVGAAGNSLDEALLAARLFARGLAETIL